MLNKIKEKFKYDKKDIILFSSFIFVSFAVFFIAKFFNINLNSVLFWIAVFLFSILCLIVWYRAGVIILKSLITPSIGFSIIIFLTQTYCDLPEASRTANDALKSLFIFGLIYSMVAFIGTLKKELLGDEENLGELRFLEKENKSKNPKIIIFLYAIFLGLFMWEFYQVATPIINNLCIFPSKKLY